MNPADSLLSLPTNTMAITLVIVAVVLIVGWLVLKVVARAILAIVLVGLLLVGLVVAAGRLTNQPPERIVDSAVATVTTEITRTARDGMGREAPPSPVPARP